MKHLLRRAAALPLALILLASATPGLAQSRLVTPNPSVVGLPGPYAFDGSEWLNFRQGREGVTAPITTLLAQEGVRQAAATVTTAAFTVPNDPSAFYLMNSASAQAVTVPAGLTRFAPGATLTFVQLGAGQLQLAAAAGVTINKSSSTLNSAGQYRVVTLVCVGTDSWVATGGLS